MPNTVCSTAARLLWYWTAAANVMAFSLMGIDKRRAARGQGARRIPERTLFFWAVAFGGVGGTAGMRLFRHKTRHWYFKLFFPLLAVLQLAVLGWLLWKVYF